MRKIKPWGIIDNNNSNRNDGNKYDRSNNSS